MEEIPRYGDRWSVTEWPPTDQFRDKRGTRGSGGREIREEITRYGDRWSVTEWPPIDQFQGKHPGENARSNRAPISHRVHCRRGSCYTQLNWDSDSQRERYAWTSHDHTSEKEELLVGIVVHESGLRESVNRSVIGYSLNPLRAWHREGEIVYAESNAW